MTSLRLITWNINSVRLRIEAVAALVARERPDILALQEIKCRDGEFPAAAFRQMGLPHVATVGQKGLHGVAVASRLPLEVLDPPPFCHLGHARVQAVRVGGIVLHNLYVPAGGDEPDPEINDKFDHKLRFLRAMRTHYASVRDGPPLVVVGDLNVAPGEHDVWSHKQLLKIVSHTPVETELLDAIRDEGGFADLARVRHEASEKLYSWWSYRARDWLAADKGRRLDHIWANGAARPMTTDLSDFAVLKDVRGWERPSDHAPVRVSLKAL
jgi:exodeoxyribonuclease III